VVSFSGSYSRVQGSNLGQYIEFLSEICADPPRGWLAYYFTIVLEGGNKDNSFKLVYSRQELISFACKKFS
jgi:hypothetical protein